MLWGLKSRDSDAFRSEAPDRHKQLVCLANVMNANREMMDTIECAVNKVFRTAKEGDGDSAGGGGGKGRGGGSKARGRGGDWGGAKGAAREACCFVWSLPLCNPAKCHARGAASSNAPKDTTHQAADHPPPNNTNQARARCLTSASTAPRPPLGALTSQTSSRKTRAAGWGAGPCAAPPRMLAARVSWGFGCLCEACWRCGACGAGDRGTMPGGLSDQAAPSPPPAHVCRWRSCRLTRPAWG